MTEAEARAALGAFDAVGEVEQWVAAQRWEAIAGAGGCGGGTPTIRQGQNEPGGDPADHGTAARTGWRPGSNGVPLLSMAQATSSSRSPTVRKARPWVWPALRSSP